MPRQGPTSISLRPATDEDFSFLQSLHRATMRDYVDQTWGWDEHWQNEHFIERFNPASMQIIVDGTEPIGAISVVFAPDHVFLSEIQVLPSRQNQGIGTAMVKQTIQQAGQRTVQLQVLKVNPARRLYERLGFQIIDETATHFIMIRRGRAGACGA